MKQRADLQLHMGMFSPDTSSDVLLTLHHLPLPLPATDQREAQFRASTIRRNDEEWSCNTFIKAEAGPPTDNFDEVADFSFLVEIVVLAGWQKAVW